MSPSKRSICTVGLALVVGATVRPVSSAVPAPTVSDRSILVTVLDAGGTPVRDVGAADISVREDGAARVVTAVTPAEDPLFVAVLVDTSQPAMGTIPPVRDLRAGLEAFVTTVQTADAASQVALYEFGGASMRTVNFTTRTPDLTRAIRRLFPNQRSSAVLLEALVDAARDLRGKDSPRRAVVAVTFASNETSQVQPQTVADEVRKTGASVWAVTVQGTVDPATAQAGVRAPDALGPVREVILAHLPDASGGQWLTAVSASGLEPMLTRVAQALASQFLVTYTRPDDAPAPNVVQASVKGGGKVLVAPVVR